MAGLLKAIEDFGRTTGDYWSQDNARFESTNPSFLDRVGRAVNPMTSFGSALGAWSDAAGKGFPVVDTGAALLQALPTFGSVARVATPGVGAVKAGVKVIDNSLRNFGAAALASAGMDEAQAASQPDYGNRPDGTKKGTGYLGELPLKGGGVATEYSAQSQAVKVGGKTVDFPTLVPTLTKKELDMMLNDVIPNGKPPPESVMQKAIDHARKRIDAGESPFAN